LEAPTYPPAAAFEQPVAAPYVLRLANVSLAELMRMPAAWDIVLKHLPSLKLMTSSAMMKPHLGNFTVQSVQTFNQAATPEVLAAIDEELGRLAPVQEPAP
jgi:hypothetical protein